MMRKRRILLAALVVALGLVLWLRPRSPHESAPGSEVSKPAPPVHKEPGNGVVQRPETPQALRTKARPEAEQTPELSPAVQEYVRNKLADPQYDWKQPISFYGRVVDEGNQPVASAIAHFSWTDLSPSGTSEADAQSDSNGLFSLVGRTGKRVSVTVSKEGFYTTPSEKLSSFEYANPADGLFTPDPNQPVVFHLRKKGAGAELVTSAYGASWNFPIHIPRDGAPVDIDLLKRSVGQNGQLRISETKPDYGHWKAANSWSFRMEIPDGGFVEENDEFEFEAPQTNYQPIIEFRFEKGTPGWADGIRRNYYIKFGEPPRYGRLRVETSIDMGGATLSYAINPDGTRNLEPK